MPAPDRKRRITAFAVAMAVLIATPLAVVAADAFNDVPDSNVHHEDITWLRDNGVTFGCNPPANTEFCPGDPVLRQQMASFMRRLAENEVVNADTANEADHATTADSASSADDAETLDGQDGIFYESRVATASGSFVDGTQFPDQDGEASNVEISNPDAGVFTVETTASWDLGTYVVVTWAEMDTATPCDAYTDGDAIPGTIVSDGTSGDTANTAGQGAIDVGAAGTHQFYHCVQTFSGTTGTNLGHSMSVQWHPSATATAASADPSGTAPTPQEGSITDK